MSQEGVKQVIGRAVVDADFKNLLMSDPAEALRGFDLTEEETAGFKKLPQADFDKLLSAVETRVSKAGLIHASMSQMAPGRKT